MSFGKQLAEINSEPNVVPMCDIMLVLLIIFMVITPLLQNGTSVDMVQAVNPRAMPDADKEDAVMVAITRDGRILDWVSPAALLPAAREPYGRRYPRGDSQWECK